MLEMKGVSSSNIDSFAYDADKKELHINFHKTGLYIYENVDLETVNSFMAAESKGKFAAKYLKGLQFRKAT